jgi:putative hydrolase of the HAD superfamily
MNPRALVFDLAGVLLDFRGPDYVYARSGGRVDEEAYFRFWSQAKCAHDLHCGRCSPEEFAREAVREWQLDVTPQDFLADYRTWFRGPYEGALELLETLKPRYRLACLSNANVLDVKRFREEVQLQRWLDACLYSNELGLRKPDPAAYLSVSKALALPPRDIAFFDDSVENVNGAIAVGMQGHHVRGFTDLTDVLRRLGIEPSVL